jgi:hypothetical protein
MPNYKPMLLRFILLVVCVESALLAHESKNDLRELGRHQISGGRICGLHKLPIRRLRSTLVEGPTLRERLLRIARTMSVIRVGAANSAGKGCASPQGSASPLLETALTQCLRFRFAGPMNKVGSSPKGLPCRPFGYATPSGRAPGRQGQADHHRRRSYECALASAYRRRLLGAHPVP